MTRRIKVPKRKPYKLKLTTKDRIELKRHVAAFRACPNDCVFTVKTTSSRVVGAMFYRLARNFAVKSAHVFESKGCYECVFHFGE